MTVNIASPFGAGLSPSRRQILKTAPGLIAVAGAISSPVSAQQMSGSSQAGTQTAMPAPELQGSNIVGYNLEHEQFPVPELVQFGADASQAGFGALAYSDHLQPWQANEGHAGQAWVTLSAVGSQALSSWIGTMVTCPTIRYNPAVVAEAFASLSLLYPGRVFLGVGSGEAVNEEAATGYWPPWSERWGRLIEAISIIRALWSGEQVQFQGQYYTVNAKLYDPPAQPIPLLTAANGMKSMRLAGQYGDGLITDPKTWQQYKTEWQEGANAAGKDPGQMPVMVQQYVVVGDQSDAQQAAELWRFLPKAFTTYYNIPSPVEIEQLADQQVPLSQVIAQWVVGTDPSVHINAINELFNSGVSVVEIVSGQPDQQRVIGFYGDNVLPQFRSPS